MATSRMSSTSVAISQMPKLPVPPPTAELPIVAGGTNFSTTVKAIVDSVTKETIGLGKVENYAPSEMPVSNPVQTELDKKMDKGSKIPMVDVEGLQSTLERKLDKGALIPMGDVEGLQQALADKLGKNDQIEQSQVNGLNTALDGKLGKDDSIAMAQVEGLIAELGDKLGKSDQIEQSQVNGLEIRLHAIETDPILSERVSDFEPAVQAIIDAQPFAGQQVVQGIHQW